MKRIITLILTALMTICACLSLTACGGIKYTKSNAQLDALTEVKAGTSDIAVIDSVMANFYLSQDNYSDLQILDAVKFDFVQEYYSIGTRKNTDTATYINYALYELQQKGTVTEIAKKYNLQNVLATIPTTQNPGAPVANSDWDGILKANSLKLGYTIFEPIAYSNGEKLVGFDIELAQAVCEFYNINLTTIEINWDTKDAELNGKNIDVIWNGLTYTEERAQNYNFTANYMLNKQAVVIRKADVSLFVDCNSLKNAKFTAESASAGEEAIQNIISKKIFG